jgi:hypothetical protein
VKRKIARKRNCLPIQIIAVGDEDVEEKRNKKLSSLFTQTILNFITRLDGTFGDAL